MSPARDIADRLASLSVGTIGANSGWSISVSREPIAPPSAITVYDTGADAPDTDELDINGPAFQVRVRAKDYETAWAKQIEIREALIRSTFSSGSVRYFCINLMSGPLSIGLDDQDMHILTANYSALTAPA